MYTASEEGAFLNGRPIRTANARPLRECILSLGDFSRKKESYRKAQAVIMSECYSDVARFKVMGAACVDFAYLADARTDVHLRFVNRIWDFMPGLYLAQKAGAVYDESLMQEHNILVLCSCKDVLDEAVGTLVPRFISCFRQP
jgi:fructose-1,6-bisphosphatase/inositol monophosphatase family enzyme